jgi:hypothetical protein
MPARDGTGPRGQGPRTGRGLGNCASSSGRNAKAATAMISNRAGWGGRVWDATFGRLFRRRRFFRNNRV